MSVEDIGTILVLALVAAGVAVGLGAFLGHRIYRKVADERMRILAESEARQGEIEDLRNANAKLQAESTALQAQSASLAEQGERLRELNQEKNRLLGTAAHDLRGPISLIVGYTKLALREDLSDDVRALVEQVDQSSSLMRRLLDDLLDISRIEAGSFELRRERTDLAGIVHKTAELYQILAARKDMRIEVEIEDEVPEVSVDAVRIQQVLANLLSNAVKYSFPGTPIHLRVSRGDDEVLLTVRDQGQGIPADEVQSIFQEFQRASVKTTGGETATGLGLAIAKKVVEAHQGAIGVWSVVGEGSTFYVSLPYDERPERIAARLPLRFATLGEGRGGSATVLDLSPSGALLETTVPLEVGSRLRWTLILDDDEILTGEGGVVREAAPGSYGISLDAFDDNGQERLTQYLESTPGTTS